MSPVLRSSRRLRLNATFHVDEKVEICLSLRWPRIPSDLDTNASTPRVGSPLNVAGAVGFDAEENGDDAEPGLRVFEPPIDVYSGECIPHDYLAAKDQ